MRFNISRPATDANSHSTSVIRTVLPTTSSPARTHFAASPVTAKFRVGLTALWLSWLALEVRPLGVDIATNSVVAQVGWPAGAVALANDPHRVAGYWINQTDTF